jgi:hypothetical protein
LSGNDPWMHGIKLDHGWLESGFLSSAGGSLTLAATPNPYHPDWGQTWPVRMGDGNILHYRNDRLALMQFLSNPDVRNFYGYSHGSPMAFFGWYGEAYKRRVHHRYRYVFLDGCMTTTGIGDVYRALGATDVETIFPVYPPDEVTSNTNLITDMNYYNNVAKVRPGVFMGWKVESFSKHYVDPAATDAITGQSSHWAVYEAMCNWHGQFLFYWALGNDGVVQAVEDANFWAMSDYSDPPVDYSLTTQTVDPNGHLTEILFDPATCLRIFGLADMHFTWFNEDWEWP